MGWRWNSCPKKKPEWQPELSTPSGWAARPLLSHCMAPFFPLSWGLASKMSFNLFLAKTWIDKLAAGDINFPLQAVASDKADALKIILENGYNSSFHYTLWAISIILVGLMMAIYKLIHSGKD